MDAVWDSLPSELQDAFDLSNFWDLEAPLKVPHTLQHWEGWRVGKTAMSHPFTPFVAAACYLVTVGVLRFGMSFKKERFQLKAISIVHNVWLAVWSLMMTIGVTDAMLRVYSVGGLEALFCDSHRIQPRWWDQNLSYWTYVFLLSKYYEFIDTFLLVLKKKPLKFLHVYHHIVTLYLVFVALATNATFGWVLMIANCFVHTIMYSYYALTNLGRRPWWKKYLTKLQIAQFFVDMTGISVWAWIKYNGQPCLGSWYVYKTAMAILVSFIILFALFYIETYNKGKQGGAKQGGAKDMPKGEKDEATDGATAGVSNAASTTGGSVTKRKAAVDDSPDGGPATRTRSRRA